MQVQTRSIQTISAPQRSVLSDGPNLANTPTVQTPRSIPTPFPQLSGSLPQDGEIKSDLKLVGKALKKGLTPKFPNLAPETLSSKGIMSQKTMSASYNISPAPKIHFEGSPVMITGSPGFNNNP